MTRSFRNALYTKASASKTTTKMWFVNDLPKILLKYISETFKIATLKRIKPIIKTIKEMQYFNESSKVLLKLISETFSK